MEDTSPPASQAPLPAGGRRRRKVDRHDSESDDEGEREKRRRYAKAHFFEKEAEQSDDSGDEEEEEEMKRIEEEEEARKGTQDLFTDNSDDEEEASSPITRTAPVISQQISSSTLDDTALANALDEFEKTHASQPAPASQRNKPFFGDRLDQIPYADKVIANEEWHVKFDQEINTHMTEDERADRSPDALRARVNCALAVSHTERPATQLNSSFVLKRLAAMANLLNDSSAPEFEFRVDRTIAKKMIDGGLVATFIKRAAGEHCAGSDVDKVSYWDPRRGELVNCGEGIKHALAIFASAEVHKVQYRLDVSCGRLLTDMPKGKGVIYPLYMQGAMRRLLLGSIYHDIDMVNSGVTFMHEICRLINVGPLPFLDTYYLHREYVLKYIMECCGATREDAKHAMVVATYGGCSKLSTPFLEGYMQDLKNAISGIKMLMKVNYTPMAKKLKLLFPKLPSDISRTGNTFGRDLGYVASRIESVCALLANKVVTTFNFRCGSLIYDGLMVERNEGQNIPDLCKAMTDFILQATGLNVDFIEKPMTVTRKDFDWLCNPPLAVSIRDYLMPYLAEQPQEMEADITLESTQRLNRMYLNQRIPDLMVSSDGDIHFQTTDQDDHLAVRKKENATLALKREVLRYAQEHKLFRSYMTAVVFKLSDKLPMFLEMAFTSMLDLINHVGHSSPHQPEAKIEAIAEELTYKAFAPGIFPFVSLGNTELEDKKLNFAFCPAPQYWAFEDGQVDISKVDTDPDGSDPPNLEPMDFDRIAGMKMKFYSKDIPDQAKYMQYTVRGIPAHWEDWVDEDGNEHKGVSNSCDDDIPNFIRLIMTQVCDKDFNPGRDEANSEETLALIVILAMIGRFFLPNNFIDDWQVFLFCYGESSVGKGSLNLLLKSLIPSFLVAELSGSSRKGNGGLQHTIYREYVSVVEADNFSELVPIGVFKSMVSGETIDVAQLYKASKPVPWRKSMILTGQSPSDLYKNDPAGAVVRRLCPLWWRHRHINSDSTVEKGVITERAHVFALAVKSYQNLLRALQGIKLMEWPDLPSYFKISKKQIEENISIGTRFFTHTHTFGSQVPIRYVPYIMTPEDKGRAGWVQHETLLSDLRLFGSTDPVLSKWDSNPLLGNWLAEARSALQSLYERIRKVQLSIHGDGPSVWPLWDFSLIQKEKRYRCCKTHNSMQHGQALVGETFCGCAAKNENKQGSVIAVIGLQRLVGDDIEKWFDQMGVDE